jgi:thiamine biosynthesis lipoprotein
LRPESPQLVAGRRWVEQIMGMPIEIELCDEQLSEAAVADAFDVLRAADERFSTYRADSEISRLARGEIALSECHPDVDEVLSRCARLRDETEGYFSVRAGGRLDPSGLVKGWAVGRAADALAGAGARNFAINAGGDVIARGRPAPDDVWRIGIRHPIEHHRVAAVVGGTDLAVATSGEYERGAHVLDPHTGTPPSGLLSVTVVGDDLATADAYATAVFAMGAAGPEWALSLPSYDALCITSDHSVLSTPGMGRHRVS